MSERVKPTHTQPGGFQGKPPKPDDELVNDSLGTVDPADSTWPEMKTRKPATHF